MATVKKGRLVAAGVTSSTKKAPNITGDWIDVQNRTIGKMQTGGKTPKAKGGKWIQKAIKKPGALRKQLGAKPGKPIPASKLTAAAKKPGKLGQRARLAKTLSKMRKKQ